MVVEFQFFRGFEISAKLPPYYQWDYIPTTIQLTIFKGFKGRGFLQKIEVVGFHFM